MAGIFSVITSLRDQLSEERDEIADVTVDKLYPHIPRLVKYADHSNTLPWTQEAQGVLMFADISGFTALCEKYSSLSTAGIDNLTTTLNGYLESLVEQILASEGDVLKFAGDAILAFWPTSHNDATEVIQNVIRCCLDIQERCGDYETNIGVTLSVKMGIAFGDITFSFVGNDEFRHYVESGSAVDDVRMAQALCDPHQVVMSPRAWNQCDHRKFRFVRLSHGKHVRVLSMKEEMETSKYSMKKPSLDNTFITEDSVLASGALTMAETGISQQIEVGAKKGIRRYNALRKFQRAVSVLGHISKNLRFYVPSPVLRKLDDNQPLEYLSEMRSISVVFVNLTLCDYSNITELMQTLFQTICQHVHTMQGCLNKIFLFDKGCSFLVIFGLPGNKQEHDRDHALQCAVVIAEDLAKEDRVSETSIGVTTGTAFCGVVGHRERHEYSVIGRKVNMAARLMMYYPGKITCDDETFRGSDLPTHGFSIVSTKAMKGLENTGVLRQLVLKRNSHDVVHLHTLRHSRKPLLGRKVELDVFSEILQKQTSVDNKLPQTETLVIEADSGMGKTRLLDAMTSRAMAAGFRVVSCALNLDDVSKPYFLVCMLLRILLADQSEGYLSDEDAFASGLRRNHLLKYLPFVKFIMIEKASNLHEVVENNDELCSSLHRAIISIFTKTLQSLGTTVFAIDDIHFADSYSWDLLADLQKQRAIFVVTIKPPQMGQNLPNGCKDLLAQTSTEKICLEGLETQYLCGLACQLLNVTRIPGEIHRILVDKSSGSPAWCEHLLQGLLCSKQLEIVTENEVCKDHLAATVAPDSGGRPTSWHDRSERVCVLCPDVQSENLTIPESIKDMVIARVDALRASEQMLVKCASVLGVRFYRKTLIQILPTRVKEKRVDVRIGNLLDAGIFVCGNTHSSEHVAKRNCLCENETKRRCRRKSSFCCFLRFRDAMLQEIVYNTLLQNQRENLHKKAAQQLDTLAEKYRARLNPNIIDRDCISFAEHNPCLHSSDSSDSLGFTRTDSLTTEYSECETKEDSSLSGDNSDSDIETDTACFSKLVPLYCKIAYHWHCAGELIQELATLTEATSATLALEHFYRAGSLLQSAKEVLAQIERGLGTSTSHSTNQTFCHRIKERLQLLQNEVDQRKRCTHDSRDYISALSVLGQWYPVRRRAAIIGQSWKLRAQRRLSQQNCCLKRQRVSKPEEIPGGTADLPRGGTLNSKRTNSTLLDALLLFHVPLPETAPRLTRQASFDCLPLLKRRSISERDSATLERHFGGGCPLIMQRCPESQELRSCNLDTPLPRFRQDSKHIRSLYRTSMWTVITTFRNIWRVTVRALDFFRVTLLLLGRLTCRFLHRPVCPREGRAV